MSFMTFDNLRKREAAEKAIKDLLEVEKVETKAKAARKKKEAGGK